MVILGIFQLDMQFDEMIFPQFNTNPFDMIWWMIKTHLSENDEAYFLPKILSRSMTITWILFQNFVVGHLMGRGFDWKFPLAHQPSI